ncbi:MAG: hypothetical protein AAFX53_07165 [Bacteroidota bacterium]
MSQKIKSLIYLSCFIASAIFYEVTTTPEDSTLPIETAELVKAETEHASNEVKLFENIKK